MDNENAYLKVVEDAELNKWCVDRRCSTCFADKYRAALKQIPDLQSALISLNLDQFTSHTNWHDFLMIMFWDHRQSFDWGIILKAWLPYALEHICFADYVLYYIVRRAKCDKKTRTEWITTFMDFAIHTKNRPLIESFIRIYGPASKRFNGLLETAFEISPRCCLLRNALAKAGLIPSDEDIKREEKRKIDGQKFFGAIRGRDIVAVRSLLKKSADLKVKGPDGGRLWNMPNSSDRTTLQL